MRFIRAKSRLTPPSGALRCPSSDVPAPKGMIGVRLSRHRLTISTTSPVFSGKITASGGWLGIQVVVWACCLREAPRYRHSAGRSEASARRGAASRCAAAIFVGLGHRPVVMGSAPVRGGSEHRCDRRHHSGKRRQSANLAGSGLAPHTPAASHINRRPPKRQRRALPSKNLATALPTRIRRSAMP